MEKSEKKYEDFKRIFNFVEGIPSRRSKLGPSTTVQSPTTTTKLFEDNPQEEKIQ